MDAPLSKRSNLRRLLALAAPIAVSQLAQTSMGFVDTVMVGRLGPTDLAAVSLGSAVFFGILVFALGTLIGVGPITAQALGAGRRAKIASTVRAGLALALALTPAVVGVLYVVRGAIGAVIDETAVAELASGYLGAVSWSVLPFLGFVALRSWLEALNRPLAVTAFALLAVGVNVLGNYAFVYGGFGLPRLGAVGTGYATSLSYAFLFVGLLGYALSRRSLRAYAGLGEPPGADASEQPATGLGFAGAEVLEILRVGLPIGASFAIEVGLFSATAVLVGALGKTELAAHQIAIQCASVAFMLPLSVALASTVRVGNLVGAGALAGARHAGWLGIALGTGLMVISAVCFNLFPEPLVALFLGAEPAPGNREVAELAAGLLALAGAFQLVDGLQGTAAGALRGLKDTLAPMLIGLVSYWGVGLTSGVVLARSHGVHGYWMGLVLGLSVAGALLVGRWWRLSRRLGVAAV